MISAEELDAALKTGDPIQTAMTGWRWWELSDGWLRSPFQHPHAERLSSAALERSFIWPRREFRPICPRNGEHVPPVADCTCGVYFSPRPYDIFWAAEKARELDMDYAGQGFRPDSPLVVGLLEFKPPIYVYLDRFNQFGWEGRAAGATIKRLFISDAILPPAHARPEDKWRAQSLLGLLKTRYRVPITAGRPEGVELFRGTMGSGKRWAP
ncbi:hypothetical protein Y900_024165 [Mycolicibacterium aromaticivorans JS19b1 = JCM 16368]|uniref:Uncharacterized protein n=1 Tax=Mycolicibacterium aromaticivorans JS19b1 = JCM 16368 TaxID=1440774 RepID=A0A064CSY7_9MYCO|nr:hypothetical protein [Mycolicibacterium aromaticivorans]KDF01938.1 hypothetical protein Y900_024165 [Mycolicibacterium aromaticivorans JS19b1 = JCM 16368]